ncbi:ABC transporter ATP-binding protein [Kribbella italica]|uniref:Iron complex transport system ATP-binding protein n=1 Tax=Kribbella italica TaxID=1540520 RepID=A0A7W9JAF7_9ACTN|nr:ABC transporter ATP-binding protein [Kribbella italica]MBB5837853.1 iron complex transport system ATP-binding protein [Kribbella italica]
MRESVGLTGAGLRLGYHGRLVVDEAGLGIEPAGVTALVGPNGSGKSTLLRAMARLHKPDAGTVCFADGEDALALSQKDFARKVTLLSQSRPTPNGVSVRDVVGYGRHPYRGRWRNDDPDGNAAIEHAMDVTGVTSMAERAVDELSGGELQRVWLATCLAQDTGVLLLDEPTTFLDLRYQIEILDLMRDLADEHGVAVGVVLHDLNQAADVADRIVLLDQGRVRSTGTPGEVLQADALTETYGIRIDVSTDPVTGRISTQPVGRHLHRHVLQNHCLQDI